MKRIIDIPEEQYNFIRLSDKSVFADASSKECMLNSIKNSTSYEERPQGEWIRLDLAKRVIAKFKGYLDEDMIGRIQLALEKENEADIRKGGVE